MVDGVVLVRARGTNLITTGIHQGEISDLLKSSLIIMRKRKAARECMLFLYEQWVLPVFKISVPASNALDAVKNC